MLMFLHTVRNPIVTVSGPEQATVGNPLVISCTANTISGIDASLVIFSWRGPSGDLIMNNNNRVNISKTTSGDNNHTSYLQLAYVVRGDQGFYTCNVTILHTNATVEKSHEIRRLNGELFVECNFDQ